MSCHICKLGDSSPRNFLLKCSICSTSWHHRCHSPVVQDRDLVELIKASTRGDHHSGLRAWKCRICQSTPALTLTLDLTLSDDEDQNIIQSAIPVSVLAADHPAIKRDAILLNIATTWLHKRYSDAGDPDAWDRLATKKKMKLPSATRRCRKTNSISSRRFTPPDKPFAFVSADWFAARRNIVQEP